MDDGSEKKRAKETEKAVIKRQLMFESYIDSLYNDTVILSTKCTF